MKKVCLFFLVACMVAGVAWAQNGVKKKRLPPQDYGKVILNHYSEKANLAPVVFDHWLHRSKYTCRLCHVDIGFEMKANDTNIRAADNASGNYCGTCHNGKSTSDGQKIFASCSTSPRPQTAQDAQRCNRCHSVGQNFASRNDFQNLTGKFPRKRFGNGIDWVETESARLITLTDKLDGVTGKSKPFQTPQDSTIKPKVDGMPDIVFSHDKHGVWNGCESCHPDLFPSVKKGTSQVYSMNEIFDGKYCGACHGMVAFPMIDCQRCHSKPVGL